MSGTTMARTQPTPVTDDPGDFAPWEKRKLIALFGGSVDVFRARIAKTNVDCSRPRIDPSKEPRRIVKPIVERAPRATTNTREAVTPPVRPSLMECAECGKPFAPRNNQQKFCTNACQEAEENRRKREVNKAAVMASLPLLCAHCTAPFARETSSHAYCSTDCRRAARNDRSKASRRLCLNPRDCVTCGESFAPKRNDSRACSESCENRRYKAAAKARRESAVNQ